jgi:hypothetical protein
MPLGFVRILLELLAGGSARTYQWRKGLPHIALGSGFAGTSAPTSRKQTLANLIEQRLPTVW